MNAGKIIIPIIICLFLMLLVAFIPDYSYGNIFIPAKFIFIFVPFIAFVALAFKILKDI